MKLIIIQNKCALSFHILYIIIYYYEMKAPTTTKSIDLFIEVISMALFLFYQRKKKVLLKYKKKSCNEREREILSLPERRRFM